MTGPEDHQPGSRRAADGADAARYLDHVREELDDLPLTQRDELLEDLAGHLHEASADSGQPLDRTLGTPQAYAAELRASAGLPPRAAARRVGRRPAPGAQLVDATARRARELGDLARETPQGRAVLDFVRQLRPAWWVLRGYLVLAVPAALGVLFGIGVPPFLTLFGSDLLGLLAVVAAVLTSVRLGLRSDGLPVSQRQLVVVCNVGVLLLALVGGLALRERVSYDDGGVVYASTESGYLQGPDGGISNIYAFDALGRPLQDVQLFDQDGRPLDTLLLEAPDGSYAEPVRALDQNGLEVGNVFPRTLVAETWGPDGQPTTAPVVPPAIVPRRLATPTPTPTPTPSTAPATPTAAPSAAPTLAPTPAVPPTPAAVPTTAAPASPVPVPPR